jgi:hypothetical protein
MRNDLNLDELKLGDLEPGDLVREAVHFRQPDRRRGGFCGANAIGRSEGRQE